MVQGPPLCFTVKNVIANASQCYCRLCFVSWQLYSSVAICAKQRKTLLYGRTTGPLIHLPSPEISKWTGILTVYYWFSGKRPQYVQSLHRKYSPVICISPDKVDICDIGAVKEIHRTRTRFLKSPKYYLRLTPTENLFSTTIRCASPLNAVSLRTLSRTLLWQALSLSSPPWFAWLLIECPKSWIRAVLWTCSSGRCSRQLMSLGS